MSIKMDILKIYQFPALHLTLHKEISNPEGEYKQIKERTAPSIKQKEQETRTKKAFKVRRTKMQEQPNINTPTNKNRKAGTNSIMSQP